MPELSDMITMAEFVATRGIALNVLATYRNQKDEDGWEHTRYTVRLTRAGNPLPMVTAWRAGLGIKDAPQAPEVLDALVNDATSYTNAQSFEDWAEDFGYDTDSRKAYATYEACGKIARDLESWLGGDDFLFAAENVERL